MSKKRSVDLTKSFSPERYFPCKHCGKWRRQHVKVDRARKCPFDTTFFEPKPAKELTAFERNEIQARVALLEHELLRPAQKYAEDLEQALDLLKDAAGKHCPHMDEDGYTIEKRPTQAGAKYKTYCECTICGEDWYE